MEVATTILAALGHAHGSRVVHISWSLALAAETNTKPFSPDSMYIMGKPNLKLAKKCENVSTNVELVSQ